jgi:hypothetical protein
MRSLLRFVEKLGAVALSKPPPDKPDVHPQNVQILLAELSEQYHQYRFIGQAQALLFTFYGTLVAASFAAMSLLKSEKERVPPDVLGVALIFLGLAGILVGVGTVASRAMQGRTQMYLATLLHGLSGFDGVTEQTRKALYFRSICSTAGRFGLYDTVNTAAVIVNSIGVSCLAVGIFILSGASLSAWPKWKLLGMPLLFFIVAYLLTWAEAGVAVRKRRTLYKSLEEALLEGGKNIDLDRMLNTFTKTRTKR